MSTSPYAWHGLAKEKAGGDRERLAAIDAIAPMIDWVTRRLAQLRIEGTLSMPPADPLMPGLDTEMFDPESWDE